MSLPRIHDGDFTYGTSNIVAGGIPLHPVECTVTEVRNGEFELEMRIHYTADFFNKIKIGTIIIAPHDATGIYTPFEVYSINNELNGMAQINAWTLAYRGNRVIIRPFSVENKPLSEILNMLRVQMSYVDYGFTVSLYTDIPNTKVKSFEVDRVTSLRDVMARPGNSLADVFGGEILYDNVGGIAIYANRGKQSGIILKYGVNIVSMTREQTAEDFFTGVYPYWTQEETMVTLPEYVLNNDRLSQYHYRGEKRIIPLDLSSSFKTQPTTVQLRSLAESWMDDNCPIYVPENIDISILQMDDDGKSKIAKLNLCDTLTISYPEMQISVAAKVTKVVFNVLLDRYDSISVGTTTNMNTAIKKVVGIR